MDEIESEIVLLGGAFTLAPIVGCAIAIPLFLYTGQAFWSMVIGTVAGMAIYVAACLIQRRLHQRKIDE